MAFRVAEDAWEEKITGLARGINDPSALPPFIAEYRDGELSLRDGSHRHEALRRLGVTRFWTLIWFNTEAAYESGRHQLEALEIKPTLSREEVREVLQTDGDGDVTDLEPILGGQISQTFSFRRRSRDLIIRFATRRGRTGFSKEAYVAGRFGSPKLPMARILRIGTHRNLCFAISERVRGQTMRALSPGDRAAVLPALVEIVHALRRADVAPETGFGLFDHEGRGFSSCWSDHLTGIRHEEEPTDFYGRWHALFEQTFLERDLFERIYGTMRGLLVHCPEERSLVHGNLGYGNILVAEGRITAVIDWADARYGDFLYDIAGLDFWHRDDGHAERFRRSCAEKMIPIPRYPERIAAYQCAIALDALRFFARTNQRSSYDWVRSEIMGRLAR